MVAHLAGDDENDAAGTPATCSVLIVGNHCHDVLFRPNGLMLASTLGGAVSFVSAVLEHLLPTFASSVYVSKVGSDFAYSDHTRLHPPTLSPTSSPTTLFHAHFPSPSDRILTRVRSCDPIDPEDLPDRDPHVRIRFGLAAAVAGEISPQTLARMIQLCEFTFADIQALIRNFDPVDGRVKLSPLASTEFIDLIPEITFLKTSSEEAVFVDVEQVRQLCCLIVTEGKNGCRIISKDREVRIAPFQARQIDPTGAGDSFLGGLIAGLLWGLPVPDAALLGNFFGAATVAHVGVPNFHRDMLQGVKKILEDTGLRFDSSAKDATFSFEKSHIHDELYESLEEVATNHGDAADSGDCFPANH